jgi:hypothetical protein
VTPAQILLSQPECAKICARQCIILCTSFYASRTYWPCLTSFQRTAIEETKAVFPPLRQRITDALQKLEDQLEATESNGASADEVTKAKEVIAQAKKIGTE